MAVGTRDPDKLAGPSDSLDLALNDPSKAASPNRYDSGYDPNKDSEIPNLLSLPSEVLIKIMLLSEARDRVNLRYVSRRLRSISETPSLWREFVWSDCRYCEEKHLYNVLKVYGTHVRRLSFPQHLVQPVGTKCSYTTLAFVNTSEMMKMLQCCNNLTHLNLPPLDHADRYFAEQVIMKSMQKMKHLQVLSIHCYHSLQPYLNLRVNLEKLTTHTQFAFKKYSNIFENWMSNGFIPPNLNFVLDYSTTLRCSMLIGSLKNFLLDAWPIWNSQIPVGHIACLKLYIGYTAPLNLFQNAPVFQLQYGQPVSLPFVQANNIGLTDKWLLLTDHNDGSRTVYKGKLCITLSHAMNCTIHDHGSDNQLQQDCRVSNLTELDLSECNLDLKLLYILVACPHLQRLNLSKNKRLRLEDLQAIATCCCNLQGLNLGRILIPDSKFYVKVWEILSTMQLTHLAMDFKMTDDMDRKQLAALFKQFTMLQTLELYSSKFVNDSKYPTIKIDYELLAYFPSLEYCRLNYTRQSTCVQDILAVCKKLRYFYCNCSVQQSQLSVHNNLQQLCISSWCTNIDDNFMDMVSAHGGLIHVALFVKSVTRKGITTLIKNSPNLLSFRLDEQKMYTENDFESLSASLRKKFCHRKLFTSGSFGLASVIIDDDWLQNTDLLSLWPPEQ